MAPARRFYFLAFLLLSFVIAAVAQNDFPTLTSNNPNGQTSAASSDASSGASSNTGTSQPATTATDSSAASTGTDSSATSATATSTNSQPSLTSSTNPNLPTLSGVLPPPLIVPNTADAPYMQHSNLPEGTVFIAVGGVLAFLGFCVLAWRAMVAYSLHRSVKRAANAAFISDSKSMFTFGDAQTRYSSLPNSANMSMEHLSHMDTAYAGTGRTNQKKEANRTLTSSSLFFSPTGAGMNTAQSLSNRSSSHLPSGFYAQGSSAPNGGDLIGHVGSGPATTSGYRHMSYGGDGAGSPSPPESPAIRPAGSSRPSSGYRRQGSGDNHQLAAPTDGRPHRKSKLSMSESMDTAAPSQGRAPSAYLEGLMDTHGYGPRERF